MNLLHEPQVRGFLVQSRDVTARAGRAPHPPPEPLGAGKQAKWMLAWVTPLVDAHRGGHVGRALSQRAPLFLDPDQPVFQPAE